MGLSKFNDKDISFEVDLLSKGGPYFYVNIDEDEFYELDIPLDFINSSLKDFSSNNYDVFFLLKKDVKESEVIRLCKPNENETVGYLLPLISLESNAHVYANDRYFLRYSYIAIHEILKRCDVSSVMKKIDVNQTSFKLSDFFNDEMVICIIYKNMLDIGDFSKIAPVMFKNGFIRANSKKPNELQYKVKSNDDSVKITLYQVNPIIVEAPLIDKILHEQFPYEKNIAFKFFILYQVIELLMERVYNYFQSKIINELLIHRENIHKSKEILSEIQDVSSEKRRLKSLFSTFITTFDNKNELKNACFGLTQRLIDNNTKEGKDFVDYFYPIRNYIVHNYRSFPDNELDNLDTILDYFIDALPSILSKYEEINIINESET